MKTNSLFWALSWVAVGSFAVMQGCGGDDDDDGGDGTTGGKGGSAGSGTGGKGGSAGSGTGGKAGSATGGTSGAAGAPGGAGGEDSGGGGEGGAAPAARAQVCTDYCQLYYDKDCEVSAANTYTDEPDCRDTCNAAAWDLGSLGDAAGDSVHCRLTHAGLASATARPDETHCGHASAEPTGVCE